MGFNTYRKMLHMKKDPFEDYKLKGTEEDRLKMIEFSNTLNEISKTCFQQCADFSREGFSRKEEKCVKGCVDWQFQSMHNILKLHNNEKKEGEIIK